MDKDETKKIVQIKESIESMLRITLSSSFNYEKKAWELKILDFNN